MAYKITNNCINCGACESECPYAAITSDGGIHRINPDKCTECIDDFDTPQCEGFCLIEACVPDPAHRETAEQLRAKRKALHPDVKPRANFEPEILETQIVVAGGGGTGLAAAVAAAEKGADVIVLEKRRRLGGNSRQAGQVFAVDSPVQKRMNININKDKLFREAMKFSRWTINPRIVKAFMDKSGDTIRWLEEKGEVILKSPK